MVFHGTFKNGVVILDEKPDLPEGARVQVRIEATHGEETQRAFSTTQKLLALSGVITDGPSDASVNHDHYLYGAPKREQGY